MHNSRKGLSIYNSVRNYDDLSKVFLNHLDLDPTIYLISLTLTLASAATPKPRHRWPGNRLLNATGTPSPPAPGQERTSYLRRSKGHAAKRSFASGGGGHLIQRWRGQSFIFTSATTSLLGNFSLLPASRRLQGLELLLRWLNVTFPSSSIRIPKSNLQPAGYY